MVLSVIIPCYNTEKYLPECLDSVCAQDIEDMEILCIDDGSPDESAAIVCQLQARDPRIRLISQDNMGLSGARNTGFREAVGDYVYFLDSDDRISDNTILRRCCERMRNEQLDVLYGAADVFFDPPELEGQVLKNERAYFTVKHEYPGVFTGPELISLLRKNGDWCASVPAKLFRREYLSGIGLQHIVGQVHEDEYFSFCALFLSHRIGVTREALYDRRVRGDSIMTQPVTWQRALGNLTNMIEILRVMEAHRDSRGLDVSTGTAVLSAKRNLARMVLEFSDAERSKLLDSLSPDQLFYYTTFVKDDVYWRGRSADLERRLAAAQESLAAEKQSHDKDRQRLRKIEQSRSYRFLRALLRPVVSLRSHFAFFRKYPDTPRRLFRILLSSRPTIYLLGTPFHGNLGDHLIAAAEKQFFTDWFPEKRFIDCPMPFAIRYLGFLQKHIRKNDIVCVSGGGWLGSLWPDDERFVRRVVKTFANNPVVIFPQTVFYKDDPAFMESGAKVYSSHPRLLFCLREKASYDFVVAHGFAAESNALLMPDFALDYKRGLSTAAPKENKILLCFRKDREILCGDSVREAFAGAAASFAPVKDVSTIVPGSIPLKARDAAVADKIREFSAGRLLITDRLHGMIIAALAGIPCLAFDNATHKVRGVFEWLRGLGNIMIADPDGDPAGQIRALLDKPQAEGALAEVFRPYAPLLKQRMDEIWSR